MKLFVLRRADVVKNVGGCDLIAVFDETVARAQSFKGKQRPHWLPVVADGNLVYQNGWLEENTRNLIDASPRAFWLMARAGLIPVTEKEALQTLLREGKTLEPLRAPVANVQRVAEDSMFILRMQLHRPNRTPALPPPVRVVSIEDEAPAAGV